MLFVDMVRRRRDEVGGKHKGRKSYDRWLVREKSAPILENVDADC